MKNRRQWITAAIVTAVFAATAGILLRLMPRPHSQSDYLMAGTCATLLALVALFAALGGMGAFKPRR